jgi:hypothetical protein
VIAVGEDLHDLRLVSVIVSPSFLMLALDQLNLDALATNPRVVCILEGVPHGELRNGHNTSRNRSWTMGSRQLFGW